MRRSARLSGGEQKRYSPRPDPDEVYVASYRSFALVNILLEFWVIAPVLAPLISRMGMLVA